MQTLLRPSDVRRLGTSRSWVYQAAKDGSLPSIHPGGDHGPLRFVEQDIESWIDDARARWCPGRPPVPARPARPARSGKGDEACVQLELDV
jgi:predicted DNA-binding transcriptional regulator AlpA